MRSGAKIAMRGSSEIYSCDAKHVVAGKLAGSRWVSSDCERKEEKSDCLRLEVVK